MPVVDNRKPQEEDLVENFPGFSSQFLVDSGNVSRSDVSLQSENQRLRDLLEKERYRRKVSLLSFDLVSSPEPLGSQGELIGWP